MNAYSQPLPTASMTSRQSMVRSLFGTVLLGVVILFATGFSNADVTHNAAHDARHASGFPCH